MTDNIKFDPKLDLVFEKTVAVPIEKIWKGWTDSATLNKWFCPRPWKVTDSRLDLRPGGEFYTLMEGPAGEKMPNNGCYLEVVEGKKLVWTNMMTKGYRPSDIQNPGFPFVATILMSKTDKGTHYKAIIQHATEEARKAHEKMGFQEGWGAAFNQLLELMK